jgi:hypothetical protein
MRRFSHKNNFAWGNPLLRHSDLVVSNNGGYPWNPITNTLGAAVGADTLKSFSYLGKNYAQVEGARVFTWDYNTAPDPNWTRTRVTTPAATGPASIYDSLAWKLTPTVDNNTHLVQTNNANNTAGIPDMLQIRCKNDGYKKLQVNSTFKYAVRLDIDTLATSVLGGAAAMTVTSYADGWVLWTIVEAVGFGGTAFSISVVDDAGNNSFAGDGVKGIRLYLPNKEVGTAFPTSPAAVGAASLTRNADVYYWPAALVPTAFKSGGFTVKLINEWAHTEPAGDTVLYAVDANNYVEWDNTAKTFACYVGGVKKMESNAVTLARYANPTLTMNFATGATTTTGFATGDGTNAGTACALPAGDLYFGGDSAGANQMFCALGEPYPL